MASPHVSHSSSRPTHNTFQNDRLPRDGICYKPLYDHFQPCAGPLYLRGRPTSRALSLRPMFALFMSSISCPPVSSFMLFHNQVWIKSRQGQDRIRPGSTSWQVVCFLCRQAAAALLERSRGGCLWVTQAADCVWRKQPFEKIKFRLPLSSGISCGVGCQVVCMVWVCRCFLSRVSWNVCHCTSVQVEQVFTETWRRRCSPNCDSYLLHQVHCHFLSLVMTPQIKCSPNISTC